MNNLRVDTRRQTIHNPIYAMGVDRRTPIAEILEQIKNYENNDNIECEITHSGNLTFYVVLQETDEDYNNRIERETKQINEINERYEKDRYNAYLELKQIYEPKK